MAIDLGLPRRTIRLQTVNGNVRLVDSKNTDTDHTDKMIAASSAYVRQNHSLSGYILKNKSPSCGMERVNLYNESGMPQKTGVGFFANELLNAQPDLPVEEEGRLNDAGVRENFIQRVFAYHRWQCINRDALSVAALIEFHKRHKLILLAHDQARYRYLGKLVASTRKENLLEKSAEYISQFMQAIKKPATRNRHVNVLQHSMGYLKKQIDKEDKVELLNLFERYAKGEIPLVVPITMLKYHFRKNPQDYINEQFYMNPYPENLMLRNHV